MKRKTTIKKQPTYSLPERMRRQVTHELRDKFDEFLEDGVPEDHRLMVEILRTLSSNRRPSGRGSMSLTEAFEMQLA